MEAFFGALPILLILLLVLIQNLSVVQCIPLRVGLVLILMTNAMNNLIKLQKH